MATLFPAGIAYGDAFYDRVDERQALIGAIESSRHTVLVAPRRFGKTSLMKKVIEDKQYPFLWIDFMTLTSREEAESKLLAHIANLVITLGGGEKKIRELLKKYLSVLRPEISIDAASLLSITFRPKIPKDESLVQALLGVDKIAKEAKKQAVIICDEFQEIIHIDEGTSFQASIRHAAERAQNTTYLFSGSKHQALRRLFNGKQNPLYELCDQMSLSLIKDTYYYEYLQKASLKRWGDALKQDTLQGIIDSTECYPKYVNALCAKLWRYEALPTLVDVRATWSDYMYTRKSGIREELEALKINERRLLRVLCNTPTEQPFSKAFLMTVDLSQSNVKRALEQLQEKDLVCFFNDEYRVIDPTYKHYFDMFG
jgi:uncharacterized protein